MKSIMITSIAALLLFSCGKPTVDTKAEGEKLMQISRDWSKAASSGDVEKIVSYWNDDAVLIQPGMPMIKGRKEIRQMVEGMIKTPGFKISWEPQSAEVSETGDLAYLVEKSQTTMTDSTGKSITQHTNGVTVWKKQADGSWKNVVDIGTPVQ